MASGNTLIILRAQDGRPATTNGPAFNLRNNHPILQFDADTDETAYFEGVLPRNYAGGGLTVYIHFSMTSAILLTVEWEVGFERIGDGSQDIDSDGFASTQASGAITVPDTSGNVKISPVTFTDGAQMDSIAAGEAFRLSINRDANDVTNDTATGDAELLFIEIKET